MWVEISIWVAMTVVSAWLANKNTPKPDQAKPLDVEASTVDASSPVPVLFGSRKMTANCVWWGDVGTTPIQTKSGGKK